MRWKSEADVVEPLLSSTLGCQFSLAPSLRKYSVCVCVCARGEVWSDWPDPNDLCVRAGVGAV